MKFLREVPYLNVTPQMLTAEKQGDLVLIWREETVELWYPMTDEEKLKKVA